VIRAGVRRLLVALVVVLGGAAAISAVLGALAHRSILHSLAIGYYLVGAAILLGSLAFGSRGPNRVERNPEVDPLREIERPGPLGILGGMSGPRTRGRRSLRKATPEERRESRLTSIALFVFGVLIVLLGAALDPTRRAF